MTSLSWLHFTDLHQGMDGQKWLWPTVRSAFYTDLERVLKKLGTLDLVFFTGDLTQKAAPAEFIQLNETLADMWSFFKRHGHTPLFVPVPGNHDLRRPEKTNPYAKLIRLSWHTDPDVQKDFWENPESEYRKLIAVIFEPYSQWLKTLPLPTLRYTTGIIPGDFSSVFEKDGFRLGIVGLNSSFLQLFGDVDYESKLDLNERQIHSVCGNDADKWCSNNHTNLLLTHHPPSWLDPSAKDRFRMDIAPPGRFFAHLCGHLHTTQVELLAEGGGVTS
ncbi:metallophosphoesterase [Vitiosangium sp. GDMCC 1.1324]|uniref:metallophosphoesterase family protein n=1 Tax=Vitiosangium sp. (strain GDMCC 1.1324) TaxID=2138576 RepID=UPI000D3984D9|nr:metallophosphoesterase [Vitiosangium sp. GDMCC 1.1324]PTL75079.1 hypothetical protein DAT35_56880 [Vitiosangium sp. GDMCC 1.1324]